MWSIPWTRRHLSSLDARTHFARLTLPHRCIMSAAGYELRGIYGTEPYWPEKKLKICITGAGGFIASHLAMRLKQEGHHIVACDWKRNEHMEVCCFVCVLSSFVSGVETSIGDYD